MQLKSYNFNKIAAIESRGFVFASAISYILKKPFIMLRKKNKLPADVHSIDFELEYGTATIEVHKDSINKDDKVLIIDDLIATGGTAEAAARLVEISEGTVSGFIFVINLFDLGGNDKLVKKDYHKMAVKVGPSESMSKSKKNVIDPEYIINNYGADSVRLFILSDSPPEKDVQWSDQGMVSAFKFIQKLWILNQKILDEIQKKHLNDVDSEFEKVTNIFIKNFTDNLSKFTYNKIIANFYEIYSSLSKLIKKKLKNFKPR